MFDHIDFIRQNDINPEIYFSSDTLDEFSPDNKKLDALRGLFGAGRMACSVHGPFMDLCAGAVDRKVRAVTVERFTHALGIASALGARSLVLHSGYEHWKFDHKIDTWLEGSLETWPPLIELARKGGTRIAVENIFEWEPGPLAALMGRLGCEHFGVCFDIGHYNLFTKKPLSLWLDSLAPYITQLHLHDNHGDIDAHLAMGEGSIRYEELFERLRGRDLLYTIEARSSAAVLKSRNRIEELLGLRA